MAFKDFLRNTKEFFLGSPGSIKQAKTLSPEQSQLLSNLLGQLSPEQFQLTGNPLYKSGETYLNRLLSNDPEATAAFEAPALRQFQQQIVPGIAERFTNLGAQKSSAFNQALAQSGKDLAVDLQALRSGMQMQALPQAFQYATAPSELGLQLGRLGLGTQAFQNLYQQGSQGLLQSLLGGIAGGASAGFGNILGAAAASKAFPKTFGALAPSSGAFAPGV